MSNRCCIICYRECSDNINHSLQAREKLKRFFLLLGRYLGYGHGGRNEKKRQFPIYEWVDDPESVVLACGECSVLTDSFCELYHQMKAVELLLQWKVWTMRRIMSCAGKVPSRVKGFRKWVRQRQGRDENSGRLLDAVLEFRRSLRKKCARKLQTATPKVSLVRCQSENDSKNGILGMTTSTENKRLEGTNMSMKMTLPVSVLDSAGINLRDKDDSKLRSDPSVIPRVKTCACAISKRVRKSIRLARNRRKLRMKITKRKFDRNSDPVSASANKVAPETFPICRYLNIFKSSSSSQSVKREGSQNQCETKTTTFSENNDEFAPDETAEDQIAAKNLTRNSPSPNPNQSFSSIRLVPIPSSSTSSASSRSSDKDEWSIIEDVTTEDQTGEIRTEINIHENKLAVDFSMLELEPQSCQENRSAPISTTKVAVEKLAQVVFENLPLCSSDCELDLESLQTSTSTKYEPETEEHLSEHSSANCVLDGSMNIVVEHIEIHDDDDVDDGQNQTVNVEDGNEEAIAAEIISIDVEEQAGIEGRSIPVNVEDCNSSLIEIERDEQTSNSNEEVVSSWVPPVCENEDEAEAFTISTNEEEVAKQGPPTDLQISRLRPVYRCIKCMKTFSTPGKLTEHWQSNHADDTKSDDESESDYYNDDSDSYVEEEEEEIELEEVGMGRRETRASSSKSAKKFEPQRHFSNSSVDSLVCKAGNCSEKLYSQEDYDNHQKLHGKFPCFFCDSVQDFAPDLAWHEIQVHSDDLTMQKISKWVAQKTGKSDRETKRWGKLFRCPRPGCSYGIGRKGDYIAHHVTAHQDLIMAKLSHTCKICKFVCAQKWLPSVKSDMKKHFNLHHNIDRLGKGEIIQRCDQKDCEAYFLKPLQLDKHKTKFHGIRKIHQCADCPISYLEHRSLCAHRQREHPANVANYRCSFEGCLREFETEAKLKSHVTFVHTKKMTIMSCPKCKKQCRGKWQLILHMKKHTNPNPKKKEDKRFVCEQCGKGFKFKDTLDTHYFSHSGSESWEFSCSQCGKKCMTRQKLEEHLRTHSKDKPFVCDHCGEKYSHRHNLRNHVNSKHGDVVKDLPRKFDTTNLTSRKGVKRNANSCTPTTPNKTCSDDKTTAAGFSKSSRCDKTNLASTRGVKRKGNKNNTSSNIATRRSKRSRKEKKQSDL